MILEPLQLIDRNLPHVVECVYTLTVGIVFIAVPRDLLPAKVTRIARLGRRLTVDMPRAPGKRPAGGHPRHRSKTRRRPEPITTTKFALLGDACVHGGWLSAAASHGDLEGRVHGGHPSRASSPFFTAGGRAIRYHYSAGLVLSLCLASADSVIEQLTSDCLCQWKFGL